MNNHIKKLIAPVIIAVLLIIYYIGIAIALIYITDFPKIAMVLFIIIPLALAGVVIYVLYERIKEIRSGEEDDLSKY